MVRSTWGFASRFFANFDVCAWFRARLPCCALVSGDEDEVIFILIMTTMTNLVAIRRRVVFTPCFPVLAELYP